MATPLSAPPRGNRGVPGETGGVPVAAIWIRMGAGAGLGVSCLLSALGASGAELGASRWPGSGLRSALKLDQVVFADYPQSALQEVAMFRNVWLAFAAKAT